MKATLLALAAHVALASAAGAATLTITPDKQTYLVGETITLNVFGDAEGAQWNGIFGRILFDAGLATYVSSTQEPLTSFGGAAPWTLGLLVGGAGFGDAFIQVLSVNPYPVDGPLTASVKLLATAPGSLDYSWQTTGDINYNLAFFGLTNAPGGSVTIIPEPATGALLALGLLGFAVKRAIRRP